MNELRAPDPTLTAHGVEDADVILTYLDRDVPPVAHRVGWGVRPACGHEDDDPDPWARTDHARWFAVPCRECFPDAPEPGGGHDALCGIEGCKSDCGPDALDWQIPVDNDRASVGISPISKSQRRQTR